MKNTCDICGKTDLKCVVDGKTQMGPWAWMCPGCHRQWGLGFGTGKGQKFVLAYKGWVKTDG